MTQKINLTTVNNIQKEISKVIDAIADMFEVSMDIDATEIMEAIIYQVQSTLNISKKSATNLMRLGMHRFATNKGIDSPYNEAQLKIIISNALEF